LGKPRNVCGLAASRVLYGDLVIQVVDQGTTPDDKLSFIVALRAKGGVAVWGQDRPVRAAWNTPLVYRGPAGDGGSELLAIRTGGRGDVTKSGVAWTSDVSVPEAASPVCDGMRYYHISAGGALCCLDAATGKELWTKELDGQYWASPVLVGQRLYVVNKEGLMSVISTADGQLQSRVKLPEKVTASPAVLGGRIYLRTASHLMCIGKP